MDNPAVASPIDIDDLREPQIRLYGLSNADGVYTFYHDETNNIRRLHINAGRLNVAELSVFVLGGLVHEGGPRPIELQALREAMRIQKSAGEIKLQHVAKGGFLDVLGSRKLTTFLQWIAGSELTIHYHQLDPLYWSIVDIIDSILPNLGDPGLFPYHVLLKSDLAMVLRCDIGATVHLFHAYGYPGLAPEGRKPFLQQLVELVDYHKAVLPTDNAMILRSVLRAGRSLKSLDFIEGYPSNLLIEEFSTFYLGRIALFKNSSHVFDMEDNIRGLLLKSPLTSNGRPVTSFRFADSKHEPGIQLSDVVVGVLGKMHSYFTHTERDEVAEDRAALNEVGLENAVLLRDLISRSHKTNIGFLNHVANMHDLDKLNLFLRFLDGIYA
ncbi:hypothetical protein GGD66_006440 [Bradyrhizobium sp. CIR48]|uniref:DUF3800 domain-containing protein n=1 Tax=Bradyrhizobium sp. CIR48 TaxID=2663840 RepID=UPI0017ECCD05|nr:DUF3800 domain-containing protein [Bradyrhizobium sp. CIR48]MBB4427857.1 hypothetical protein [Bradyrhizobium sp. CIR48]